MTPAIRYPSIQIARAMAALAVVVTHSQALPEALGIAHYSHGLWSFGQAGVDIFFIISGFIIASVLQKPQTVGQFVARRSLRILPFYWGFTLVWAVILLTGFDAPPGSSDLVASFAVLPQDVVPVLGVGWSLEHELIFYAIVALLVWIGRADAMLGVMAVFAAASLIAHIALQRAVDSGVIGHILSLYHVQFLVGVALFRWQSKLVDLPWKSTILLGAILFPLAAALLHILYNSAVPAQPVGILGIARVVLWGVAGALVLAGLLACEAQQPDVMRTAPARGMILIGGASYVLYLSHPIVIALVGLALRPVWPVVWPPHLAEAIAIAAALGFALVFYRWIEEPMLARLSRLADAVSGGTTPRVRVPQ